MLRLVAMPKGVATFLLLLAMLLNGCTASLFPGKYARDLATDAGWQEHLYKNKNFDLLAFVSPFIESEIITVYVEGDGDSWQDRFNPSLDPTPSNPVGLRLALADRRESLGVYLARPCQYSGHKHPNCHPYYWTNGRFSPEIIETYNQVLDRLKKEYSGKGFRLLGYSGGGVIAAILAGQRRDVDSLITFAAPLDVDSWLSLHQYSPLRGSLSPLDYRDRLSGIEQSHFIGAKDKNVPQAIIFSYINKIGNNPRSRALVIEEADHECCWDRLLRQGKISYQ